MLCFHTERELASQLWAVSVERAQATTKHIANHITSCACVVAWCRAVCVVSYTFSYFCFRIAWFRESTSIRLCSLTPELPATMSALRMALPSRVYQLLIRKADPMVPAKMRTLWEHPAGMGNTDLQHTVRDIENTNTRLTLSSDHLHPCIFSLKSCQKVHCAGTQSHTCAMIVIFLETVLCWCTKAYKKCVYINLYIFDCCTVQVRRPSSSGRRVSNG